MKIGMLLLKYAKAKGIDVDDIEGEIKTAGVGARKGWRMGNQTNSRWSTAIPQLCRLTVPLHTHTNTRPLTFHRSCGAPSWAWTVVIGSGQAQEQHQHR